MTPEEFLGHPLALHQMGFDKYHIEVDGKSYEIDPSKIVLREPRHSYGYAPWMSAQPTIETPLMRRMKFFIVGPAGERLKTVTPEMARRMIERAGE